jgi:hypothetical protein
MCVFAAILVLFKKLRRSLILVSAASSGLIELGTIWRNLKVMNKFFKTSQIPINGVTVPTTKKLINLVPQEYPSTFNEVSALWAGHRSAIKLKNAKAEAHRVFAIAREHKDDDDDDDDADGDDADGSGAN